jgi:hypothetical protein
MRTHLGAEEATRFILSRWRDEKADGGRSILPGTRPEVHHCNTPLFRRRQHLIDEGLCNTYTNQ